MAKSESCTGATSFRRERRMMGTMFCQYETPCGWCTRLNKECTEKGGCKPKRKKAVAAAEPEEKLLNPAGEYAVKFAKNHGMSIQEALEHPMVIARHEVFAATGM